MKISVVKSAFLCLAQSGWSDGHAALIDIRQTLVVGSIAGVILKSKPFSDLPS